MNNQAPNDKKTSEILTEETITYESQISSETLIDRLHELRWSVYRLAKEHAANLGNSNPASRYHSTLTKALADINKSSLGTIKSIVHALRGEIIIVWHDVPEEEKGKHNNDKVSPEERLEKLEFMLTQVLQKLGKS